MKTVTKYVLVSLLVAVGGASTARASETTQSEGAHSAVKPGTGSEPEQTWVMGHIASIGTSKLAINTEDGSRRSLGLTHNTEIVVGGKRARAHDLKPAESVLVGYVGHGKHAVARLVQLEEKSPVNSSAASPASSSAMTATKISSASKSGTN